MKFLKQLLSILSIVSLFLAFALVIFFLRELIDKLVHNISHSQIPFAWLMVILILGLSLLIRKRYKKDNQSHSYVYRHYWRFIGPILLIVSIIGLLLSLWRQ